MLASFTSIEATRLSTCSLLDYCLQEANSPSCSEGQFTLDIAESRVGLGAVFFAPKRRFILSRGGVGTIQWEDCGLVQVWSREIYVRQWILLYEMAHEFPQTLGSFRVTRLE